MNIFELPIHPQADIFPMLPDDELQELAEDIKKNGLNIPIVIGEHEGEMHVIDGRNRREACRIAGVKPAHQELNGQDQTAYIASSNLNRRHMTRSQKAMAMAMLYPESRQGRKETSPKNGEVKSEYLRMARKILRNLPETAQAVLVGAVSLVDAYGQARAEEKKNDSVEVRMERLRSASAGLHEAVLRGDLTLTGAEGEVIERKRIEKVKRSAVFTNFRDSLYLSEMIDGEDNQDDLVASLNEYAKEFESLATYGKKEAISRLRKVQQNIELFIEKMED